MKNPYRSGGTMKNPLMLFLAIVIVVLGVMLMLGSWFDIWKIVDYHFPGLPIKFALAFLGMVAIRIGVEIGIKHV